MNLDRRQGQGLKLRPQTLDLKFLRRILHCFLIDAGCIGDPSGLVVGIAQMFDQCRIFIDQLNGAFEVLVNNSAGPPAGPLLEAAPADFEKALRRHLFASHTLVQLLLPGMREAGYGRIINIISTSVREPIPGLGVSNTVRGAMAAWAKTLSRELPPGVTINSILPGYTSTQRLEELKQTLATQRGVSPAEVEAAWLATVPEGRLAQPSELGAVIAFLASPAAGFVRGVALPVDGGRLASI